MAMLSIDITCPHCLKDNAVMKFVQQTPLSARFFSLVFQCQSCFKLLVAEVETDITGGPANLGKVRISMSFLPKLTR